MADDQLPDELLRLAARCARHERVTKHEAAIWFRYAWEDNRRLRSRVAELEGAGDGMTIAEATTIVGFDGTDRGVDELRDEAARLLDARRGPGGSGDAGPGEG
jgi:hypothetical protein